MSTPRSDAAPAIEVAEIHTLVDLPCETGEGPLWHESSHTLCWVDIPAGTLYRFEPVTGMNGVIYQHTGSIGGFTIQEDDSLVIFSDDGAIARFQEGEVETIIPGIEALGGSRFNDVIADPEGRIFCTHLARTIGPRTTLHTAYPRICYLAHTSHCMLLCIRIASLHLSVEK